jgi:hypothetical protein
MKWVVALTLLWLAAPAFASASLTGTYSSLHYNDEGGDLLGHEITILQGRTGFMLRFQIVEGVAAKPITVPVKIEGANFRFDIPRSKEGGGVYSGTITKAGLVMDRGGAKMAALAGSAARRTFLLPRKCSYWRRCPNSRNLSR